MKGLRLWKPDFLLRFLAFFNFLYFSSEQEKRHLKKQHILCPQSRIARPEETMPTFGTRTPGEVHYLGGLHSLHTDTTAFGYMCLEFATGSTWYFFFFDRTIPDLLGSDLMTTMVTLGIFLRGGLWKCYSWLFLFSLLDCQSSGYLYCVSCYLCGVLVVPCVSLFLLCFCDRKVFSGLFPTSILNLLKASG